MKNKYGVYLWLGWAMLMIVSCKPRKRVEADLWSVSMVPSQICYLHEDKLKDVGLSRVVECLSKEQHEFCSEGEKNYTEVIPYCDITVDRYHAMHRDDLKKWAKELLKR